VMILSADCRPRVLLFSLPIPFQALFSASYTEICVGADKAKI
jgi:hypothetical protein